MTDKADDLVVLSRRSYIIHRSFVRSIIYMLFINAATLGFTIATVDSNNPYFSSDYFRVIDDLPRWPQAWGLLLSALAIFAIIIYSAGHIKLLDHRITALCCLGISAWYLIWASGLFLGGVDYGHVVHYGLAALHLIAGRYLLRREAEN